MIIAVDFDDTLKIKDNPNHRLMAFLRQRQSMGDVVVLFTSRTGQRLNEAVKYCRKYGFFPNGVQGGKLRADVYIDDKSEKPIM